MSNRCAVVGTGQTHHASKRNDVTLAGLVREAAERALADAGMDWPDIDAVVLGKAPDVLEGIMSPELQLADALGAAGKPVLRAYTSGNAGGMAASTAVALVRAGVHARVMAVSFEKQSEGQAAGATLQHVPFEARWQAGTGSLFGALCKEYIHRSKAPAHIGDVAALKERQNAVLNPYAQVRKAGITLEAIAASRMLWDPIRFLHSSPSSDGACAVIVADERTTSASPPRTGTQAKTRPAWVHACTVRTEPPVAPEHDSVDPRCGSDCATALYREAGITDPQREIDVAELFVPYSWMEPLLLENLRLVRTGQEAGAEMGEGWRFVEAGGTAMTGDLPVNPSGGLLGANPIGAAGLVRFAEAAMQIRETAGDHQIDGARIALGHAAGGYSNAVAMWIVGRDRP